MKPIFIRTLLGVSLTMFTTSLLAAQSCDVTATEKEGQFSVTTTEGMYKGYVSRNSDGTWLAWVDQQGASNTAYTSQQEAVVYVCTTRTD